MKTIMRMIALIVVILVYGVHFGVGEEARLTDPYQIYNKHLAAIGGLEKLKSLEKTYIEGEISIMGLKGPFKSWTCGSDKDRNEFDIKVFKQTQASNGTVLWQTDSNGKLQIIKDELSLKRKDVEKRMRLFEHIVPNSPVFKLELEGIQKVGEQDCYAIAINNTISGEKSVDFINCTTFLKEKTTQKIDSQDQETLFSDYRDVEGTKQPFHLEFLILPVNQKFSVQCSRIEINGDMSAALFDPPAQDVKDYVILDGKEYAEVPCRVISDHIFFPVKIGDKEKLWCLDSGAGMTVIDPKFAKEMGLVASGKMPGEGAGKIADVSFVTIPSYQVGTIRFNEQKVATIDIEKIFKRRGMDVLGILGYDFLSRFVVRIDYAGEKLTFFVPETFKYTGTGVVIDSPLKDNMLNIPIIVDGKYKGKFTLDIGAGHTTFHYPFARQNGLLDLKGFESQRMGAGGKFRARMIRFNNLEIAGFNIEKPLITIPIDEPQGAFANTERQGNLGYSVFRHFVMYLDYANQRVILEKGADFDRKFPEDHSGLGIELVEGNQLAVSFVAPDTPAAKAGFQVGDIVLAIDKCDFGVNPDPLAVQKMMQAAAGTVYKVKIRRGGKEQTLNLRLESFL